jgi:hypothetical protein
MLRFETNGLRNPGINAVVAPTYKVFISHAWGHAHYDALVELIVLTRDFSGRTQASRKENPIAMLLGLSKSARTLVREIDEPIRRVARSVPL